MSHLKNNYILEFLSQGELSDIDLNNIQALLFFDSNDNRKGSFLNPHISKCSMMPKWHQLVPLSGDVGEAEKVKSLQLYATSRCTSVSTRLQVHHPGTSCSELKHVYSYTTFKVLMTLSSSFFFPPVDTYP